MRPRVLVLASVYLPGYLAGGPVRSIANLVEWLGDEFEWIILTSDHDLGAPEPYRNVNVDSWTTVGKARVFYMGPQSRSISAILGLIRDTPHDLLYLNSFFSPRFSILPVLAQRFYSISKKPLLIAPRGEFSEGALNLKAWKKWPFIWFARAIGAYRDARWHASTEFEVQDILHVVGVSKSQVYIARNLAAPSRDSQDVSLPPRGSGNVLRVCFLSRISRMKNLDFALRVMVEISSPLHFSIFGPKEDPKYWKECERLIATLPEHIQVTYEGSLPNERIREALVEQDLLFVPTRGENFGHVFLEAWSAGVPVLTSDQTPWKQLEREGVGWDLSLEDPNRFVSILSEIAGWSPEQRADRRLICLAFAERYLNDNDAVQASRDMFRAVIRSSSQGSH